MNVGSLMSSLTTSAPDAPAAPFASAAMVSGSFDVLTVAMVSLRFPFGSPQLTAAGPSGGVQSASASTSTSVRSCRSPGPGRVRSSRVGHANDRCAHCRRAVVIPGGEIVTSAHLDRPGSLLLEGGEGSLQEIERAAEPGQ